MKLVISTLSVCAVLGVTVDIAVDTGVSSTLHNKYHDKNVVVTSLNADNNTRTGSNEQTVATNPDSARSFMISTNYAKDFLDYMNHCYAVLKPEINSGISTSSPKFINEISSFSSWGWKQYTTLETATNSHSKYIIDTENTWMELTGWYQNYAYQPKETSGDIVHEVHQHEQMYHSTLNEISNHHPADEVKHGVHPSIADVKSNSILNSPVQPRIVNGGQVTFVSSEYQRIRLPVSVIYPTLETGHLFTTSFTPISKVIHFVIPKSEMNQLSLYCLAGRFVNQRLFLAPLGWKLNYATTDHDGAWTVSLGKPGDYHEHMLLRDDGNCKTCAIADIGTYFPNMAVWAMKQGVSVAAEQEYLMIGGFNRVLDKNVVRYSYYQKHGNEVHGIGHKSSDDSHYESIEVGMQNSNLENVILQFYLNQT